MTRQSVHPRNGSNAEENLPAIHPKQNQPKGEQDRYAVQEWLVGVSENPERVLSKMGREIFEDEAVEQMRDAISGDGVHADDHQGKRPVLEAENVDDRIECSQQQTAPAAAVERPTRCPDALHDRANF